jgi:hypothetical protein
MEATIEKTFDNNLQVVARQAVLEEITFRMSKLWLIFSWTSSVLILITGGVIGLRTGDRPLDEAFQYIIAASSIVMGLYAVIWLRQNLRLEAVARDALAAHDKALGIQSYNTLIGGALPRPDIGIVVGYKITVVLLTIAAVTASLMPLR